MKRLRASAPAIGAVAAYLIGNGRDVFIPGIRYAGRDDDRSAYADRGDLEVIGRGWVDVKHFRYLPFTCQDDFTYPDYLVGQIRPWPKGPPYVHVNVNQHLTHAGVVSHEHADKFWRVDFDNKTEGCVRPSWACPIELVTWINLSD